MQQPKHFVRLSRCWHILLRALFPFVSLANPVLARQVERLLANHFKLYHNANKPLRLR